MSYPSLRVRFEDFMQRQSHVESIDELLAGRTDCHGFQRADYLSARRQIIFEQKSLESDPGDKLKTFVHKVMQQRGLTLYGEMTTDRIFAGQPDAEKLKRDFYNVVTKNVQAITRKANDQTRDTKAIFGIPRAAGVLVLLNDTSFTLDPELVMYRVAATFREMRDGGLRYPHNQSAILLQESHFLAGTAERLIPQTIVHGPTARGFQGLDRMLADFVEAWAHFNRMPYSAQTLDAMPSGYIPTKPTV